MAVPSPHPGKRRAPMSGLTLTPEGLSSACYVEQVCRAELGFWKDRERRQDLSEQLRFRANKQGQGRDHVIRAGIYCRSVCLRVNKVIIATVVIYKTPIISGSFFF